MHINTSFSRKIAVLVVGVFFSLCVLEAVLRIGGFIFVLKQEKNNISAICKIGAYRIMCLGESTTEGGGLGGAYPVALEKILNQQNIGIKFAVINKGVSRITTNFIVSNLEKDLNFYKPDMVITMMGINDTGVLYYKDIPDYNTFLFRNVRAYAFLRTLLTHSFNKINKGKDFSALAVRDTLLMPPDYHMNKNQNSFRNNNRKKEGYINHMGESTWDLSSLAPEDVKPYIRAGCYYLNRGFFDKAYSVFDNSLKLYPGNDWLLIGLGTCFREEGTYARAEEAFRKAITFNAYNDAAYFELGLCYRLQRKLIEAETQFTHAIKVNPGNYDAYLQLGQIYWEKGEPSQGEAVLKQAIAVKPEIDCAYVILGNLYKIAKKYESAADMYKKILELNPTLNEAYREMAGVYLLLGRSKESEVLLKKSLELDSGCEFTFRSLGGLYQEQGNAKEAEACFQKAESIAAASKTAYQNPITHMNYKKIKAVLDKRKIALVCVQYPMRSVIPLQKIFVGENNMIFVDNEKNFKKAIAREGIKEYFVDMFAGDFGHCTLKGNKLLAENIANVILKEYFKK